MTRQDSTRFPDDEGRGDFATGFILGIMCATVVVIAVLFVL